EFLTDEKDSSDFSFSTKDRIIDLLIIMGLLIGVKSEQLNKVGLWDNVV
ncbi:unnamed protein product, partial [marine sediment metagenome]